MGGVCQGAGEHFVLKVDVRSRKMCEREDTSQFGSERLQTAAPCGVPGLQGSVFMVQRRNSGEPAAGPWRLTDACEDWSVWSHPADGLQLHAGSDRKVSG